MKRTLPAILLAGLIGVSLLWAQDSQTDQKAVKQLQDRVQSLEQRVTALERKVEAKYVTLPSSQVPPGEKPPGRPFEFNGQTYYVVPLQQGLGGK